MKASLNKPRRLYLSQSASHLAAAQPHPTQTTNLQRHRICNYLTKLHSSNSRILRILNRIAQNQDFLCSISLLINVKRLHAHTRSFFGTSPLFLPWETERETWMKDWSRMQPYENEPTYIKANSEWASVMTPAVRKRTRRNVSPYASRNEGQSKRRQSTYFLSRYRSGLYRLSLVSRNECLRSNSALLNT